MSIESFVSVLNSSTFRGYFVVVSPSIMERLTVIHNEIEYWDFDPSEMDLNFYKGSDELILSSIVEFEDDKANILPCREE